MFCEYEKKEKRQIQIYQATKVEALFDYLYLKSNLGQNLTYELRQGLRINRDEFSKNDRGGFGQYVASTNMTKMKKALVVINNIKNAN